MSDNNYFGYPYISFIDNNIKSELNSRVSVGNRLINKTPWVKITSGIYKSGSSDELYTLSSFFVKGSNSINYNFSDIYNNEDNCPAPGIISLNVEYKSKYGGIRVAKIKVQINSLQQFNNFAPYFLNPGRSILIEWGWSNSKSGYFAMNKNEYDQLKGEKLLNAWKIINKRSNESNGLYDGMLGVVTNYSFSLNQNGGYDVDIEVTSVGSLLYGLNLHDQVNVVGESDDNNFDKSIKTIKNFVEKDLENLVDACVSGEIKNILSRYDITGDGILDDVRVYIDGDRNTTSFKFVTWGFIEDIIVSYWIGIKFKDDKLKHVFKLRSVDEINLNGKTKYISTKISNHQDLRTTNLDVCFIANTIDMRPNIIRFDTLPVNDYQHSVLTNTDKADFGYIRHIYVNLQLVKDAFLNSDTLVSALLKILNEINRVCINYWDFNLKIDETTQTMKVIDGKYTDVLLNKLINDSKSNENDSIDKKIYLFRAYGGNSIIKDISFSSKLPDDMKLVTLYSVNKSSNDNHIVNGNNESFKSIWNNNNLYKDYFIGQLHFSVDEKNSNITQNKNNNKKNVKSLSQNENNSKYSNFLKNNVLPKENKDESEEDVIKNMKSKVFSNSVETDQYSNIVIPADFEMTIDGISGIKIGDVFWLDVLPDMYIENSIFYVIGVNHSITQSGWTTTIKAILKVKSLNLKASTVRKSRNVGVSSSNYSYANISKTKVNVSDFDINVLKWIKNNMSAKFKERLQFYETQDEKHKFFKRIIDESILAGIMCVEARGPISKYGVVSNNNDADSVCRSIFNLDSNNLYSVTFFQINENSLRGIYKDMYTRVTDKGELVWKGTASEAVFYALKLLYEKFNYLYVTHFSKIQSEIVSDQQTLDKIFQWNVIASYNAGQGNVSKSMLKANTIEDLKSYNEEYVAKVLKYAEEYRKLSK